MKSDFKLKEANNPPSSPLNIRGERGGLKEADEKKLKKLTADFESVFLYYVLKTMRDTVPKSGFIDGKNGEEIYRSMMDQEVAKSMADKRESGISDMLFKQLTQKPRVNSR
mgnify:CR=1 FL=1